MPKAIIKSDSVSHLCAISVVVPHPAPSASGCLSSNEDLPGIVQKTGVAVNSASSLSGMLPFDARTPPPAQITGLLAFCHNSIALAISLASGT